LHAAVETGARGLVALLLKSGARIDLRDSDGFTPLGLAMSNGDRYTADLLRRKAAPGGRWIAPADAWR
jgi:ankyrin repeat protein